MRAYTRVDDRPIRRHDAIETPNVAVVLDASLAAAAVDGLATDGLVLVNAERPPTALEGVRVRCVPASRIAESAGSGFVNLVMVGAVAAALGEPPLAAVEDAAVELLGRKAGEERVRAAVAEGYRCLR
jgi:Pyruvate/2-oxoacid:ferredoxin oxidoreductase gamma subunit